MNYCNLCGTSLDKYSICPKCGEDYSERKHNIFFRCISMFHISDMRENILETVICFVVFSILLFVSIKTRIFVIDKSNVYESLPKFLEITATDKTVANNNIVYTFNIENTSEDEMIYNADLRFVIDDNEAQLNLVTLAPKSLGSAKITLTTYDLSNRLINTPIEKDTIKVGIKTLQSTKQSIDAGSHISKNIVTAFIIYSIFSFFGLVYGCGLENRIIRIIVKFICSGVFVLALLLLFVVVALMIGSGAEYQEHKRKQEEDMRKLRAEAAVGRIKTASHNLSVAKQTMSFNRDAKYQAARAESELTSAYADLIGAQTGSSEAKIDSIKSAARNKAVADTSNSRDSKYISARSESEIINGFADMINKKK